MNSSSQGHPACYPSRLTAKENVNSRHFMDRKGGAGSEAGLSQPQRYPESYEQAPYRSISSKSGVASPAMDIGVLSIIGLGEGRGVSRCFCFRRSASFSCSHCSAIFPQSMAAWLLDLGRRMSL